MKYLKWEDRFSVGIDDIDFEHQILIDMINMILAELDHRQNISEIRNTMSEIHAEVSAHFALEERLMLRAKYDEYEAHKADHEKLLDEIRDLMDAVEDKTELALDWLSDELSEWFSVHFATFDTRLHNKLGH